MKPDLCVIRHTYKMTGRSKMLVTMALKNSTSENMRKAADDNVNSAVVPNSLLCLNADSTGKSQTYMYILPCFIE